MIPPLRILIAFLLGIGCWVGLRTIGSNNTLWARPSCTESVVRYSNKTKQTTLTASFTNATAQALSNSTINFRLQPKEFVNELTKCFDNVDCRIYYYHFGKSGGTGVQERMEYLYPPRLDSCCNARMMDRFQKDPKKYCSLKFSSYEITSRDFLGHVMPSCYNITNQSRSIVLVTFREPIQRTLSYIHQMCNKNFDRRPKRAQEACQRCSYAQDKDFWTDFLDGANDQYQQLYEVASATSLPESTILAVDLMDLSELYRDLYSATNHNKAFSIKTSANPESSAPCNFGFTSEMFRALRLANDVYRNLTLGIYKQELIVNKPNTTWNKNVLLERKADDGIRNMYPALPLGCRTRESAPLFHFISSTQEDYRDYRNRLTGKALKEGGISVDAGCDLLIPVSYAREALQNSISLKETTFGAMLNEFLPLNVVELSNEGDMLLKIIAACLARSIPIINDEALADLCIHLGVAFYIQADKRMLVCGSSIRTRHSLLVEDEESSDCVAIQNDVLAPPFDQGLADANFDVAMIQFVLHKYAISILTDQPAIVPTVNKTLGIKVSGDGRISNGGDLFGPLVAQHILGSRNQSDIQVVIGSNKTVTPSIAVVGSIAQGTVREPNLVTWGPGIIKDMKVSKPAEGAQIIAVRGPRTRDLLLAQHGLNPMVIGDPALIAGDILKTNELIAANDTKKQVCFVIHSVDRKYASEYCPFCMERLVNNYNRNPRLILESLAGCERVVSSSLHGCIFAHALAIPTLPIALGNRITGGDFKYIDYMHSVGVMSFQSRVNISQIWEGNHQNLTENEWMNMVDAMPQPQLPIQTKHFYDAFPKIV